MQRDNSGLPACFPMVMELLAAQTRSSTPIDPHEDLLASGKLTSLTSLNLLLALEATFEIRIPNSELNRANFSTLLALATLVQRHLPTN
jgi:acyl carrier protein